MDWLLLNVSLKVLLNEEENDEELEQKIMVVYYEKVEIVAKVSIEIFEAVKKIY